MLKFVLYVLLATIVIGIVAGGIHLWKVASRNQKEMAQYAKASSTPIRPLGKVLIVYYSLSGNTRDIAERIQKQTQAELYEIKLQQPLKPGIKLYYDTWKQVKDRQYPELAGNLPDFSQYDLIIVGSPVWMYTVATPVMAFLHKADFAGNPVAVFTTQGSNPGTFFTDFKNNARNAKIISQIEFNNLPTKYNIALDNKIAAWLRRL